MICSEHSKEECTTNEAISTPSAQGALTRKDIQIVSDMRLIALALKTQWDADHHRASNIAALNRIIEECESIIRRGPEELRFIIEPTVSLAAIERELRLSAFGEVR